MNPLFHSTLIICACLCFLICAYGEASKGGVNLLHLGLFFWCLAGLAR